MGIRVGDALQNFLHGKIWKRCKQYFPYGKIRKRWRNINALRMLSVDISGNAANNISRMVFGNIGETYTRYEMLLLIFIERQ